MNTFTTRQQAIDYLVSIGKPLAHAKVAIHEGYCYDHYGATDDALRTGDDEGVKFMPEPACANDFKRIEITETDALQMYDTMCGPDGYFQLTEKGWEYEGELTEHYDKEGNFIQK